MNPRVTVERRGRVAWVRYSAALERLDAEGLSLLRRAVDTQVADSDVRVLVLAGPVGRFPRLLDPEEGLRLAALAPPLPPRLVVALVALALTWFRWLPGTRSWLDLPSLQRRAALLNQRLLSEGLSSGRVVTIAALEGPVFGGGLELALACDLRVLSDAPDSFLAQPEILAGVMAGFGATHRLPKLVGEGRALELLLLGEALDPPTALAWGLVNRVLPAGTFTESVQALAERLADRAPAAVAGTIRAVRSGRGDSAELTEVLAVWASPEAVVGLRRTASLLSEVAAAQDLRPLPELLASLTPQRRHEAPSPPASP